MGNSLFEHDSLMAVYLKGAGLYFVPLLTWRDLFLLFEEGRPGRPGHLRHLVQRTHSDLCVPVSVILVQEMGFDTSGKNFQKPRCWEVDFVLLGVGLHTKKSTYDSTQLQTSSRSKRRKRKTSGNELLGGTKTACLVAAGFSCDEAGIT